MLSLSNLSRYQETTKTKTAASKIDAVPILIMGIASIHEDAFLTVLPRSETQLSIKILVDIVPYVLWQIPREICHWFCEVVRVFATHVPIKQDQTCSV